MPMQIAKVGEFSAPIAGAVQTLQWLRANGLKVGSCSGYPREVLTALPQAEAAGLKPDYVVAGDELEAGGRGPPMALANVLALGIGDVRACVKVDDTVPGIEEGLRAGMWTVGLSLSGNEVGYGVQEFAKASKDEVDARVAVAEAKLKMQAPTMWCAAWPICLRFWHRLPLKCEPGKIRSNSLKGLSILR